MLNVPWKMERNTGMRVTRKQYDKAKLAVKAASEQMKLVKAWDEALKRVGNLGNQQLVAITLNDDGSIRTECELALSRSEPRAVDDRPE